MLELRFTEPDCVAADTEIVVRVVSALIVRLLDALPFAFV